MNGLSDSAITLFVVLVRVALFGGSQVAEANGKKIADIYWNTSNPIFHFEDSGHMFIAQLRDSVDIICPKYSLGYPEDRIEYSLIYMVDRRSYETCSMDGKMARMVGICTRPYMDQVITVVFREFTPNPNMLEFASGRDYFFISTSNGSRNGLKNEQDGLCRHYNMRLRFIIEPRTLPGADAHHSHDDSSDEDYTDRRSHSGNDNHDVYRAPPPIMILPRPPGAFSRPVYGQPMNDKSSLYPARPWWNGPNFNDANADSIHKQSFDGSRRGDIRPSRSSGLHSFPFPCSLILLISLFVLLR